MYTEYGYLGTVNGRIMLFVSEAEYLEYLHQEEEE